MDSISILFKSNDLIKTKHSLTVEENRVLEKVFLEVQKQKNNIILVPKEEIDKILSNKNHKTKEGFKEFFDGIVKNRVEIKQGRNWALIALLSSVAYVEKNNEYKIEVPVTLLNFMTEYAKKGYTPINVTKYMSINKSNAQRLYELIRMWAGSKKIIEYTVQEIREYLMLEDKYKTFDNFRRRIIEPTIQELKEKKLLDIYKVEYIKKGRSVNSIKFHVKDLEPRTYDFDTKKVDSDGNKPLDGQQHIDDITPAPEAPTPKKEAPAPAKKMKYEFLPDLGYEDIRRILAKLQEFNITEIKEIQLKILAKVFDIKVIEKAVDAVLEDIVLDDFTTNNYLKEIRERATKLQEATATEVIKQEENKLDSIEKNVKKSRNFDVYIADIERSLKTNNIAIDAIEIANLKEKFGETMLDNAVNILISTNAEKKISSHLNYLKSTLENIKNNNNASATKTSNSNGSQPSNFDNFTQREYDYDKLEKQLLGWDNEEEYEN